jgi:hypothetical protein
VASFSSIEHSGLGRYGDPIDPFGDVKEVQKIRCILKPGGLFFLGVPVGADEVGYNCHRTYGRIRTAFMFAGACLTSFNFFFNQTLSATSGFELINVFYMNEKPIELDLESLYKFHQVPFDFKNYVYVLRKPF